MGNHMTFQLESIHIHSHGGYRLYLQCRVCHSHPCRHLTLFPLYLTIETLKSRQIENILINDQKIFSPFKSGSLVTFFVPNLLSKTCFHRILHYLLIIGYTLNSKVQDSLKGLPSVIVFSEGFFYAQYGSKARKERWIFIFLVPPN